MSFHRVLIMVAVEAERQMMMEFANSRVQIEVQLAGVGPIAAATNTAIQLTKQCYDLVISAGIGGGFKAKTHIGDLVIANEIISGDLGAQSEDGFLSLDKLGFGTNHIAAPKSLTTRMYNTLSASSSLKTRVHIGDIITLSTATGTLTTAHELAHRYPNAYAEAMEGYGVAFAANQAGIPVIELRSISNMVGPRQREEWDIPTALRTLKQVCSILPEVLLQ